jgi:8-amino-7-oxononanoate synthase
MHFDHPPGPTSFPSDLVDLLRHRAEHQPRDCGFVYLVDGDCEEIRWTYEELDRQARAIAATLQSMQLKGERALLLYPAGLDFIAAFFGCLYAGVIAVPAYPPRRNRNMSRVEAIADDADARVALTSQSVLDRVKVMINETRDLKRLHWLSTDRLPDGMEDHWKAVEIERGALAFLQYTSGSTGTPKGVMLTHDNLMHNSAVICYAFEHTRSGIGVFWLPSYHDMGLIGGILQPLYVGRPNVLLSPTHFLQQPFRWLSAISRYRGTISGGPNFAYDLCVEKITPEQKSTLDLSRWTLAFNGAEPVQVETLDRFVEAFSSCGFRREAFYPCYGLAEATLMVTGGYRSEPPVIRSFEAALLERNQVAQVQDPSRSASRRLVGCGNILLDQQVVIADTETLQRCPPGRIGEILVHGQSVAHGYWRRPEESRTTFHVHLGDTGEGPFLRTGDLGFLLDGELFVAGRIKDLLIVRGVNHYPQDIERTVELAHPQLRPSAGAAFTLERDGSARLVVVQEAARRRDLHFEEIFAAIRAQVAAEHDVALDAIVLIKAGSIPKTSSGKIQRHACRDEYLGGTLATVAQWHASTLSERTAFRPDQPSVNEPVPPFPAARAVGPRALERRPSSADGRSTEEIVFDLVREVARERAPRKLTLDTSILDLGLDSLERMEIVASIQETFGGRFPEDILPDLETCGQVVDAVHHYLGGRAVLRETLRAAPLGDGAAGSNADIAQFAEYLQLRQNMTLLESAGVANPYFRPHERVTGDTTWIDGRQLINFSSYNYLGMSGDPVVSQAAKQAINTYGTSVSASRLVSGEKPLHRQLETALADFLGTQDAIVFVGGHATNETTIGHLFGPGDLILHDALAHNSILQGCVLSGARRRSFPHNDWQACDRLLDSLRSDYRRVLIAVEGVYSMDGDFPDLPRFVEVKRKHDALLMVDEAHSLGAMGAHGRGMSEHFDMNPRDVDLWMGTLSKSLGSCGGYIAGCVELVELLKYTAPGFVYSVGLSPPNAAAALASLKLLEEEPERVAKLAENSALFLELARKQGLDTGLSRGTPVIPVIIGSSRASLLLSQRLFQRGINVQPILYPAVEESAARLRFFITSLHKPRQIRQAVRATAEELRRLTQPAPRPVSRRVAR